MREKEREKSEKEGRGGRILAEHEGNTHFIQDIRYKIQDTRYFIWSFQTSYIEIWFPHALQ